MSGLIKSVARGFGFGFGVPHKQTTPTILTLGTLSLSNATIPEGTPAGTQVGIFLGKTAGSVISLTDDAGGRFSSSGGILYTGPIPTDFETATFHDISGTETLAGAIGSPKPFTIRISVTNVVEGPLFVTLTLSQNTFVQGTPVTANILGTQTGSTISGSLPAGFTLNSAARTIAWDGTGSPATGTFMLAEAITVGGLPFTNNSTIGYTINSSSSIDSTITPPVISLAVAPLTYPPQLNVDFMDAQVIAGSTTSDPNADVLVVRKSTTYPVPSNATAARVILTDAIVNAGGFTFAANSDTPTFLSSIVSPAQTFFNCFIDRPSQGKHGPDSVTIKHGDASAPTMVTTSPTSAAERNVIIASLTLSEPVTVLSISGSDGALVKVAETSPSSTLTIQTADGSISNYETHPSYSYTLNVVDLAGNAAALPMVSNLTDIDEVPNTTTFSPVSSATGGNHYQVTYTVAGIPSGVTIPLTISGPGTTFKNGGPSGTGGTLGTGPITGVLNDIIVVDVQADTNPATRTAVLSGGEPSITIGSFVVTTPGQSAFLDTTVNPTIYTYSNPSSSTPKTAKNTSGTGNHPAVAASALSSGKFYSEFVIDAASSSCSIGLVDSVANLATFLGGDTGGHSIGWVANGVVWRSNAIVSASYPTWTTGDRLAMIEDETNQKVYFGKFVSGSVVWQGDPVAGTGGVTMPSGVGPFRAALMAGALNNQITACFSAADQIGAPPSGCTTRA
jgi:hypothetical protein